MHLNKACRSTKQKQLQQEFEEATHTLGSEWFEAEEQLEPTQAGTTIELKTMRDTVAAGTELFTAPETKLKHAVTSFKKVGAEKVQLTTSQLQQAAASVKQINSEQVDLAGKLGQVVDQILENHIYEIYRCSQVAGSVQGRTCTERKQKTNSGTENMIV